MNNRRKARVVVALIAAYAVALQTILLVLAIPVAGPAALAAQPICATNAAQGTGSVPAGHTRDCLTACLTGCCGGATTVPPVRAVIAFEPQVTSAHAAVPARQSTLLPPVTGSHRSRAPPRV